MHHYNGNALIFPLAYGINPNAIVDGVINGVSLHIEPPRISHVSYSKMQVSNVLYDLSYPFLEIAKAHHCHSWPAG